MGGPAAIPLSELLAYFKLYCIEDEADREEYRIIIQGLDAEYMKWYKQKYGDGK
jgi:hypothetical protein